MGGGYMELGGPNPCGGWGWGVGIWSSWHPAENPSPPPSMKNVKRDSGGGPGSEPAMVNLKDLVKGSFVFPLYSLKEKHRKSIGKA